MKNVVIAGFARSPFHFASKGKLARIRPDDLASQVVNGLLKKTGVDPNEIEEVVMAHPKVASCAAIGVPDEKSGEAIKLFVVVKPGESLTKEQVMQHMHDNLTGYKRPRYVEFRESLPTTNVGKILRRELRDEELRKLGHKK